MSSSYRVPSRLFDDRGEGNGKSLHLQKLFGLVTSCQQLWKNPENGNLHLQVHPCGAQALYIDPLPEGVEREGAMYPDGAVIDDLKETRRILYEMQRPGIAPEVSGFSFT